MAKLEGRTQKPWWHSKTLWFNTIYTVAEIALYLTDYLPEEYAVYAMGLQGIANIVLRVWFTNTRLTAK